MSERPGRASNLVGPTGKSLTIDNLPPPNTKRWVISRKAEVVSAVRQGLIGLDDACKRYCLSAEEFLNWEQLIAAHGLRGLRTTRVQHYRRRANSDGIRADTLPGVDGANRFGR